MLRAKLLTAVAANNSGGGGGAHIFWRQLVTDTHNIPGAYRYEAAEIEFLGAQGEDFCTTVGGTPTASESAFSIYPISNAFDRDNTTAYLTANSVTGDIFVQFEFSSAVEIKSFAFTCEDSSNRIDRTAKDFKIQYSDDGVNWTTVHTVTNDPELTSPSERRVYSW